MLVVKSWFVIVSQLFKVELNGKYNIDFGPV